MSAPAQMRLRNDQAALRLIADNSPIARSELQDLIGLSKPAVTDLLARLERAGLIEPSGLRASGPGPRAQLWAIRGDAGATAAIDLRHDLVEVALYDAAGRERVRARREHHSSDTLDTVVAALEDACAESGIAHGEISEAVVGVPGAIDPATGHLLYTPRFLEWTGVNVVELLSTRLGFPVDIENDVNLLALAENDERVERGITSAVFLWVDTVGLGSAVVLQGHLHRGNSGGAGEIDYLPTPDLAGPVDHGGASDLGGALDPVTILGVGARYGRSERSARDLIAACAAEYREQDSARAVIQETAARIARGAVVLITVIDPQLVILGGSYIDAGGDLLLTRVRDEVDRLLTRDRTGHLSWARQTHRDDAILTGAGQLAVARLQQRVFARGSLDS